MNYRDRVHPDLLEIYDAAPELELDDFIAFLRKYMEEEYNAAGPQTSEYVDISEKYIAGINGKEDICLRIYKPVHQDKILPGLLWIHGGGYLSGFAEQDDGLCIRFVTEAKCVVVSVEYHLAPEFPYPIPLEDCYSALQWFFDHANELNADRSRIAIAGNSAGGGLTAALSLLARDREGPPIVFQMPLYPMIDDRCNSPSCIEMQDRKAWFGESNKLAWSLYLGGISGDDVPQYAAAARAEDYSHLPATYTCIGDLDPFRDETIEYVTRLSQAGVPVEFHLYPGCFHGFDVFEAGIEIRDRAQNEYVYALYRALMV